MQKCCYLNAQKFGIELASWYQALEIIYFYEKVTKLASLALAQIIRAKWEE